MEVLVRALAEALETPLTSPLKSEIIVVQSRGMERWLSMELARYHGIVANCTFPFPNAFVLDLFRQVVDEASERSPFDPDILTWRVMTRLSDLISEPGFENIRSYVCEEGALLKRFQLSDRLADLFDQYLLFRPEMIDLWEKGQGSHWQAVLWRELVRGHEGEHRAALAEAFQRRIGAMKTVPEDFPERVSVFGISALPRFHVRILAGLSRFTDINLFLMNPCREYWGDILSGWEIGRARAGEKSACAAEEDLHLEKGNSLLASMGTLGRNFFQVIQDLECEEFSSFVDPGEKTLLACLQSDILNLIERGRDGEVKKALSRDDGSLQVHACHSPMREMEVLQDQLLDFFERYKNLTPGDILVMCPDIEAYTPYIQAVFDIPREDPRWMPFSVADRSMRHESGIIQAFMAILDLPGGRYGASRVLDILECPAVQLCFDISEQDLDLIRQWVEETGIRWGIDEKTREDLGLPAFRENTWAAGLERILLGYALPGKDEKMFGGLLPYDHIEGAQTRVLGAFLDFANRLFKGVTALGTPRSPAEWSRTLLTILDTFFSASEDSERDIQAVRDVINALGETAASTSFEFREDVDLPLITWHLGRCFERQGFGFGFLTGGLTFCAMLPMRSIPFKVVVLVGINGDAYPRQSRTLGFDLMARCPRPGDRSRRDDDRYLFLEALLSAREVFYVSYVGQDIEDNTPIPPSVLVSEILDYLDEGFEREGHSPLEHVVTRHRLQAFNPEYFKKNRAFFSYSRENCEAARRLFSPSRKDFPFISEGLSEPEETWKQVDLEDLARFYVNPAKYLLTRRLDIQLGERASILEEREAFEIRGLERYLLENRLAGKKLEGRDLLDLLPSVRASGTLPHGSVGDAVYEGMVRGIEIFANKLGPLRAGEALDPIELDVSVSGFRLTGRIEPLYRKKLLQYRYARLRPGDLLRLWIYHLGLNLAGDANDAKTSVIAGLDPGNRKEASWIAWGFEKVEKGEEVLSLLLDTYWKGLMHPLHFFPDTAWVLASEVVEKKKSTHEAFGKVKKAWQGGDYNRGEGENAYYRLCFRDKDPIDSEFERLAMMIFRPLLERRKKVD